MSEYDENNIFARIIRGEIPADKVFEDENIIAFNDVTPAAPVHVLVVPKQKYLSFDDFSAQATADEISYFFKAIQKIATEKLGLQQDGYRLITNHGANASQSVPHFHVHILGGKPLGGLIASDNLVR